MALPSMNSPEKFSLHAITLKHVSLVLVVLGLFVSGYLSYAHLTNTYVVCVENAAFQCDVVQNSVYSKMFGIPIAYFGFATYALLGGLILMNDRVQLLRENGALIVFIITLFAFLFSLYLIYVQSQLLGAYCQWCLIHEVIMTVLFIISVVQLRRYTQG